MRPERRDLAIGAAIVAVAAVVAVALGASARETISVVMVTSGAYLVGLAVVLAYAAFEARRADARAADRRARLRAARERSRQRLTRVGIDLDDVTDEQIEAILLKADAAHPDPADKLAFWKAAARALKEQADRQGGRG